MGSVLWFKVVGPRFVVFRFIVENELKLTTAHSLLSFFGQIYVATSYEV